MSEYNRHLGLLGHRAVDKVTGYSGVVSNVSFDLYGCVQAVLTPPLTPEGNLRQGEWFDVTRLDVKNGPTVVDVPDFNKGYVAEGRKGASSKPPMQRMP